MIALPIWYMNSSFEQWTVISNGTIQISTLLFALFFVYGLSGLVSFAILGYIILLGLKALLLEDYYLRFDGIESLLKWRRLHILLCDTVDQLNDCFDFILLLWISHVFINFINLSFYISNMSKENLAYGVMGMILMIQQCLHLLLITMVPQKIYDTVSRLHNSIYDAKLNICYVKGSLSDRFKLYLM